MRVLEILQRNLCSCGRSAKEQSYLFLSTSNAPRCCLVSAYKERDPFSVSCFVSRFVNNDYSRHSRFFFFAEYQLRKKAAVHLGGGRISCTLPLDPPVNTPKLFYVNESEPGGHLNLLFTNKPRLDRTE